MVALNTSTWTMINYWSSSAGYADYVAQVSVWGKVRSQSISDNTSIVDFKYRKRIYSPTNAYYETAPALWNYNNYLHRIRFANWAHSATATFAFGRVDYPANRDWSDIPISNTTDLYWSNIAHADDGTCSITYTATGTRPDGDASYEESGTITLPTIARASKPTVSTDTLMIGNSLQIYTHRASTSFTHTITVTCGGHSVTYNNVVTNQSFTASASEWMPYMTSKSMTATVSCTTYNGSTKIGSAQSTSFTLNVDTSVYKPVIGNVTHSDTNSTTSALESNGSYIIGKSTISMTIPVSINNTDYGSKLESISVTHNGVTQKYSTTATSYTATFTAIVGAGTVIIKAVDNRGVEATNTVNLTTIPYSPIKISTIQTTRVNANGDPSETGNKLKYKITYSVFWGSFGQVNNTVIVDSRYKSPSASSYSAYIQEKEETSSGTGSFGTRTIEGICTNEYSSTNQFDFYFKLTDKLSDDAVYVRIHEGIPVYAWGADHFDVYGSLHIHDRADVTKYMSFNINSVEVIPVTFNGASGGSVNWTVFKFGDLRIATCKWQSASDVVIGSSWVTILTSSNQSTPDFPFTFSNVLHKSIKYVSSANAVSADCWNGISASVSNTNGGQFYLVRPNDSGSVTANSPVFTMLVIGTV